MKARITQAIEMRDAIASPEMATETSRFLLDILQDLVDNQPIGETGSCETVADPEVAVSVIELLHDCVNAGGDLSSRNRKSSSAIRCSRCGQLSDKGISIRRFPTVRRHKRSGSNTSLQTVHID